MSVKLELCKPTTDIHGAANFDEIFYRYLVIEESAGTHTATVWFTQKQDSGCIYIVNVRLDDILNKFFEIYIDIPLDGPYYPKPNNLKVNTKCETIRYESLLNYSNMCDTVRNLCIEIMKIFKDTEHHKLYNNKNSEQISFD